MTKNTHSDDSDLGNIIVIVLAILFVIYCPNIFRCLFQVERNPPNEIQNDDRP